MKHPILFPEEHPTTKHSTFDKKHPSKIMKTDIGRPRAKIFLGLQIASKSSQAQTWVIDEEGARKRTRLDSRFLISNYNLCSACEIPTTFDTDIPVLGTRSFGTYQ